jgi:secondary thiamine-phosphate synthase enzyme
MIQELVIETHAREEMVDITERVAAAVRQSGMADGVAVVYCPHTTAGLTIQENADPDVTTDLLGHLRRLVPRLAEFRHGEGNSDAHIKSTLVGASQTIPFSGGNLRLGTWQAIYFCEFDGPRRRRVLVHSP